MIVSVGDGAGLAGLANTAMRTVRSESAGEVGVCAGSDGCSLQILLGRGTSFFCSFLTLVSVPAGGGGGPGDDGGAGPLDPWCYNEVRSCANTGPSELCERLLCVQSTAVFGVFFCTAGGHT